MEVAQAFRAAKLRHPKHVWCTVLQPEHLRQAATWSASGGGSALTKKSKTGNCSYCYESCPDSLQNKEYSPQPSAPSISSSSNSASSHRLACDRQGLEKRGGVGFCPRREGVAKGLQAVASAICAEFCSALILTNCKDTFAFCSPSASTSLSCNASTFLRVSRIQT